MADKKKKKKNSIPKTVQQSIPYLQVYDNGVIETEPGAFTKAYTLEDINFAFAVEDEQLSIFHNYERFLNTFPEKTRFQILVRNKKEDRAEFLDGIRFESKRDDLNFYRQEMNKILLKKMIQGKGNVVQEKYCIVSVEETSVETAMDILKSIDTEIDRSLKRITQGEKTKPMTLEDRLELLHSIYNQEGESVFNNAEKDGIPYFDIKKFYKMGLTSKEAIAPCSMEYKDNYFMIGETYGRAFYLEKVPSRLNTDFLSELADLPYSMLISTIYDPIEPAKGFKMVKDHLTNLSAEIALKQKQAAKDGYSGGLASPELYNAYETTSSLMSDLMGRDQRLYYVSFMVTVFGETKQQLEEATRRLTATSKGFNAPLRKLIFQQENGFDNCLPLALNKTKTNFLLTTESSSVFLPYTSQEVHQKKGTFYGLNQLTKSVIMYLRTSAQNYNGLIFGTSGSGKSMTAKLEMLSTLLRDDKNRVYVIDPESEYGELAETVHGENIVLTAGSDRFINPFDMDIDYSGDGDPLAMKTSYIISMIEIMAGSGTELTPAARSIIDRCVRLLYKPYFEAIESARKAGRDVSFLRNAAPMMSGLYNILKEQPEDTAKEIAEIVEMYAVGSLTTFAHRSNVDTNAKMVNFDIRNLGAGLLNLGLFICLNEIWNKMIDNHKKGLWTWIYIDEFYLLMRSESATRFLMEIWKRARKWNGVPTGIMQNPADLLVNEQARNITRNTSFVQLLKLEPDDRDTMAELFDLSETQLEYVTESAAGTGLIRTEKAVLPFDNTIDDESPIYELISTKRKE